MKSLRIGGVGVVSPAGVGTAFLPRPEGLTAWGASKLPDLDVSAYGWNGLKRHSRVVQYGSLAVGEALTSAGYETPLQAGIGQRIGLVVCTGCSNLNAIVAMYKDAENYGVNHVNPGLFPETVMNAFAGHLSIYFQITGTSVTLSDAVPSPNSAMLYAYDLIASDRADAVICCMVTIHPPTALAEVMHGEDALVGAESVTALLFERESMEPGAVNIRWETESALEEGSAAPLVHPADAFLAAASAYHGLRSSKTKEQQWRTSGRSEGYYSFCVTTAMSAEEEHGE
ncbi:beta-ketoacyl synthase-like protein [Paenibacillus cellulosilyticus]|uniref:Beta-ketoacyl synthase-like protein n=1 Tax=Paenibacillus cellulosilyticus TaxID=375489 RepID=A0A2V2YUD2_9BACL|nr:beta-ketoacyl synthase N-terminal-like domain-containing protein [Paenibacillus cellulosilyticus]PWW03237.1 beta-ketoacyl synthase-like protein [Paenibacillus cellulosilyticus]QKS43724.1 hypothetical protein HUB94_04200 [Paenibacillus cellulosilyticus]